MFRINERRARVLKDADVVRKQSERLFTWTASALATALCCSIVALSAPRAVAPIRLPTLQLASERVAEELAEDARRASGARALDGDPDVQRLLRLLREEGLGELTPSVDLGRAHARRDELAALAHGLFARLGQERTRALIADITQQAMAALSSASGRDAAALGLLGNFPDLLARYGYVDASGRGEAPLLAIRALYKQRLNLICERAPETGLSRLELQAYEGFNALHAGPLAPARRAEGALAFQRVEGHDADEAAAIWLYQGGARAQALTLLRRGYERTGLLRLRNMALFVSR